MKLTTNDYRSLVKMAYCEDKTWFDKVDRMSNIQVYAIFNKLKADGKIVFEDDKVFFRSDEEVRDLKKKRYETHHGHQITLEEYFGDDIIEKGEKKQNGKIK